MPTPTPVGSSVTTTLVISVLLSLGRNPAEYVLMRAFGGVLRLVPVPAGPPAPPPAPPAEPISTPAATDPVANG